MLDNLAKMAHRNRSGLGTMGWCVLLVWVAWLSGCATAPIDPAEQALRDSPAVFEVQKAPVTYQGRKVRWGGLVVDVKNLEDSTVIQVLSRPLLPSQRPDSSGKAQGRFLAKVKGFVDPEELPRGRLVTVEGNVSGIETQSVGEFPYRFPVLQVTRKTVWSEDSFYADKSRRFPRYDPRYDPLYDPFYGPYYDPLYGPFYGPYYDPFFGRFYDPFYDPFWPHRRFRHEH